MTREVPRSPFATRLSGSARETELRIRNIVSGPKKRPPLSLMLLTFLVILSCGWLISCQSAEPKQPDAPLEAGDPGSSGAQSAPQQEEDLLDLLFQQALSNSSALNTAFLVDKELLACLEGDAYTLGAACFADDYPRYSLTIGVKRASAPELVGPVFQADYQGGLPRVATFRKDGTGYLLYTANGSGQGFSGGQAGLAAFQGDLSDPDLTWVWPVEGDIRDRTSQAYADYLAYWETHKALLCPGGVEIFAADPDFFPGAGPSAVQWTLESAQVFYLPEDGEVPSGLLRQVRTWLEEFTQDRLNPWDAAGTSALWCIHSLTQDEFQYPGQQESEQAYTLVAQADGNDQLYFGANLLIDGETACVSAAYNCMVGTLEEITEQVVDPPSRQAFAEAAAP